METQEKLFHKEERHSIVSLQKNLLTLEQEKERFINNLCDFIEPLNFELLQVLGRPKANFKDVIKALCMMSYNGMSYRRTQSDLKKMYEEDKDITTTMDNTIGIGIHHGSEGLSTVIDIETAEEGRKIATAEICAASILFVAVSTAIGLAKG